MKPLHSLLIVMAAIAPCRADYQVTTCVIEMPQRRFSELMSGGKSGDELFMAAHAEVDAGRGVMVDMSSIRTKEGEKGTLESIGAEIFPLWLNNPQLPGTFEGPQRHQKVQEKLEDFRLSTPATSFETHDTGIFWETTVTTNRNGAVNLLSEWRFSRALSITKVFEWKDDAGDLHNFSFPHYKDVKIPSTLTLKPGRWTMISSQSYSADGGVDPSRKWVSFIRVDDLDAAKK